MQLENLKTLILTGANQREAYMADAFLRNKGKTLRKETETLVNSVKQHLNHSQKVFVRLSFPQETINSKDILKSLVQHMSKEYEQYSGFKIRLSKLLLFTTTVLLTSAIYYAAPIQNGVLELKKESQYHRVFPSQNPNLDTLRHSSIKKWVLGIEQASSNSKKRTEEDSINNKNPINEYLDKTYIEDLNLTKRELDFLQYSKGIDYYSYYFYGRVYDFLEPVSGIVLYGEFTLLPKYPDVVYFIFLTLAFLVVRIFSRFGRPFGLVTNLQIKKLLQALNEKCSAEIGLANSTTVMAPPLNGSRISLLSFRRSRNLKYPIANTRDIENDLIRIFDELDRVPKIFSPPEFIFVLDELDKVDPYAQITSDKPNDTEGILESDKIRRKRELVSTIVANMKIFFTTAKAKFIFIAGREMYDASLADSSDRESYLGSIFHDVIYVSSLYKDPFDDHASRTTKSVDITYLTERFVCRQLIPERADYPHNLGGYTKYVESILNSNYGIKPEKANENKSKKSKNVNYEIVERIEEQQKKVIEDELRKIINTVSVFIHYLAFRSKGSPMNMVKLFEDFAEEFPNKRDNIFDDESKLIVSRDNNPQAFYLTFDFYAQYRVSLVSGIFRPLVMETGIHLKKFSDKILVSTSYLLDHIYKFHEFGFSWRNLELLPEIIDINRAPLLRRYIEDVVTFLSDSHVKRIENGFVNFKFHRRVIEEINFLSRNSDTESAIFNFTLDESNSIKKHYRERLEKLHIDYKSHKHDKGTFLSAIAFLNSILGDLHFFDKEYDEAILYYSGAIQGLIQKSNSEHSLNETLSYTRILMKEALVYERMNSFEPALIRYSELTEIIRRNGKTLEEIGETDRLVRRYGESAVKNSSVGSKVNRRDYHFSKSLYENFSIMLLPILAKLVGIEKMSKQGITLKDSRRSDRDFHSVFDYLKKDEKYLLKVEYHLQKGNILYYKNGVLFKDYEEAQTTMNIYGHVARPHRDFNAPYSAYEEYMTGVVLLVKKFNDNFLSKFDIDDVSISNPKVGQSPEKKVVIEKYEKFTKLIESLLRNGNKSFDFEKEVLLEFIKYLKFKDGHISKLNVTYNSWNLSARLLSALGDCLLTMCDSPSLDLYSKRPELAFKPLDDHIVFMLGGCGENSFHRAQPLHVPTIEGLNAGRKLPDFKVSSRTELAIICYGCAAICYSRASEVRNYAYQHTKILFTLNTYHRFFKAINSADMASVLKNMLGNKIIQPLNKNRRFIIFPEHSKSSGNDIPVGSKTHNVVKELLEYYRFSYNTEIKLAILYWYDLYISDFDNTHFNTDCFEDFLQKLPVNSHSSVNDQMVRMYELRLKSRINRKYILKLTKLRAKAPETPSIYKNLIQGSNDPHNNLYNDHCDQELLEICNAPEYFDKVGRDEIEDKLAFLIFDSIFCELRIIESISLNNVSYIKGYYYLASAYLSLGWWIELLENYFLGGCRSEEERKNYLNQLRDMIGSHEMHYLKNSEYAYQQALSNYYECINMHSEGDVYQSALSNMYFTEGDFNDDNQHFSAAMERLLINHKQIRRRIQFIKKKLKKNTIFSD